MTPARSRAAGSHAGAEAPRGSRGDGTTADLGLFDAASAAVRTLQFLAAGLVILAYLLGGDLAPLALALAGLSLCALVFQTADARAAGLAATGAATHGAAGEPWRR